MSQKLDDLDVQARLPSLIGWSLREGKLHRIFKFAGFAEAFGFMAACALVAERMNHHPDWSNGYNVVDVKLVTHDAGGITERDFALAQRMNELALGQRI